MKILCKARQQRTEIIGFQLYDRPQIDKSRATGSRLVAARDWGGKGLVLTVHTYGLSLLSDRNVLKLDSGQVTHVVNIKKQLSYTL